MCLPTLTSILLSRVLPVGLQEFIGRQDGIPEIGVGPESENFAPKTFLLHRILHDIEYNCTYRILGVFLTF